MGIGTLRRYHDDSREVGQTAPSPESEDAAQQTQEDTREAAEAAGTVREFDARAIVAERQADLDAALAALQAPEEGASVTDLAQGVQDAAQGLHEAREAVQAAIDADTEEREAKAAEAKTEQAADTKHGDLERPAKTASTAAWIDYAKADPKGAPFDLTERPGLRDAIAAHYLGTE